MDAKSVHSADIVYNNLVFSHGRARNAEESRCIGLEGVLDDTDGGQSMREYVDESTLETELESPCDSILIQPEFNKLCENEEETNNQ